MSFDAYRLVESAWLIVVILVVAVMTWALVGCTPALVKPVVDIQRPVLPEVSADKLECLDINTYAQLRTRDVLLHQYAQELELIVCEVAECPH